MKPTVQVDFTRNRVEVGDALNNLSFPGFSEANLSDALIDTLNKLDRVKGKKAILVITTGMNTFSTGTLEDTINRIEKSDSTIFCIGLAESEYMTAETRSGGSSIGYLQSKNPLQAFADLTGGLAWFPRFEGVSYPVYYPVFHMHEINKVYRIGNVEVRALRGVTLDLLPDEFVVMPGPSGSRKSTLLNILGGHRGFCRFIGRTCGADPDLYAKLFGLKRYGRAKHPPIHPSITKS